LSYALSNSNVVLQVQNLTKVYQTTAGRVDALRGVNLSFRQGEFAAIIGPSGSGKSTLLNLIGVLDQPTDGQISVGGIPMESLADHEKAVIRNQMIGFVFQSYNLVQRTTVLNNVALPGIISHASRKTVIARARKLLEVMGIADKAHYRPVQLSGGQQQRVAIARSLINDPPIILADEPTGNLDSQTGQDVFELLRSLARKFQRTVIMVTHNLELAAAVDRAIHIRDGLVEREVWN
jgi:putative ABC transport system ATP-binding protein